jgi:hypothetical protein
VSGNARSVAAFKESKDREHFLGGVAKGRRAG